MNSLVTSARALEVAASEPGATPDLRSRVEARLDAFGATGSGTLVLTVPAPHTSAEVMLDLAALPQSFLWQAPAGAAYAGQGSVHRLRAAGVDRFAELRDQARRLFAEVSWESMTGEPARQPRLWGGMAFDPGAASQPPWSEFGDAELFLPRFLYRTRAAAHGRGARLSLAVTAAEAAEPARRSALLDQLDDLLAGLQHQADSTTLEGVTEPAAEFADLAAAEAESDDDAWVRQVDEIRRAIGRGEVEKIVAARRLRVAVPSDLKVSAVLRRLARGLRSSTRFAFRHRNGDGDSTFLGATPERLVSKLGSMLETEALAGTMEAGGEHAAELLESGKNRHEQQLVTDSIVRRLRPLCSHLEVADRPTVRELREILHLHTPIRGLLQADHHVLDLVAALHPTPAVGGVPTPEALRWIRAHETHPRGWYAAPIGWLDAHGDGEFYVALRSCVVTGGLAFLYAGAGIVGDSDPLAELRETELKTHLLRQALRG